MNILIVPAVLRPRHAASYADISLPTFWRFVKEDPTFPKVFKMGPNSSAVMRADLDAWLAAKKEAAK